MQSRRQQLQGKHYRALNAYTHRKSYITLAEISALFRAKALTRDQKNLASTIFLMTFLPTMQGFNLHSRREVLSWHRKYALK
jgi:hypothetical protein